MSRKSLIFCLVLLAVFASGIGAAVAVLYSGTETGNEKDSTLVTDDSRYLLLPAVPSDAVVVSCLSKVSDALPGMYDGLGLDESFSNLRSVVSLHYSGELVPLFLFDLGQVTDSSLENENRQQTLRSNGYFAEIFDCSSCQGLNSKLSSHSILVVSKSETLVKSSIRHLGRTVSVMDAPGFATACISTNSKNVLFISNTHAGQILPAVVTRKYQSYSGFISRVCDWTVFGFGSGTDHTAFSGTAVYDHGSDEFMTVLTSAAPASSSVAEIMPSYTIGAFTLPMEDFESYINAYDSYLDTRQALHTNRAYQKELSHKYGVAPVDLMRSIAIKEVSKAFFRTGSQIEDVLLLKLGTDKIQDVFKGTDVTSMKDYVPAIHVWPYASAVSSVFGKLFSLSDESCFTYIDGWIVIGSMKAVEEYASGRALEYTLSEYVTDAGKEGFFTGFKASFAAYFSFTADVQFLTDLFRKSFVDGFDGIFSGSEYCPAFLYVSNGRKGLEIKGDILKLDLQKKKAPVFERDTVVYVPEGPFEVKNSGTGKMNKFYQNTHLSLCLSEDGKNLWGIPFKTSICGTAQNVDYFANGKLQIAFGAGSKIYLIDRLGRFVNGFPIELGKDILIGPDVYDFNGTKKYNIMVLHKDNTVEMYNLKGLKPSSWKGISPSETIKSLPEAIKVGGSTFWVIRTSMQTLIYPFYGGEPLTVFSGDQMIRPDSEIVPLDATSVDVSCYDGKHRTVKLK